jgi:SlyX protein
MTPEELTAQVVDLQARIAYQEHTLLALDDVITTQSARIERLEARLARALERLESAGESQPGDVLDERPPHY